MSNFAFFKNIKAIIEDHKEEYIDTEEFFGVQPIITIIYDYFLISR